jgi:hypothetical protein
MRGASAPRSAAVWKRSPIRFALVCKQRFEDLTPAGEHRRHCGECQRDAYDLDRLAPDQRELLRKPEASRPPPVRTAGVPAPAR